MKEQRCELVMTDEVIQSVKRITGEKGEGIRNDI